MRIFLLHGMARTPISMALLAWRLKKAGHEPNLFGYTVLAQSLEHIADRFAERVRKVIAQDAERAGAPTSSYAVVGHSLGNLITRLASPQLPAGFARFVMITPPNRAPVIARAVRPRLVLKLAAGRATHQLLDTEFFSRLPIPAVPTLIIAGNRGPRASWLPFGGAPNDIILRVDETLIEGVETIEIPALHTFVMNRRDVFETIRHFLAAEPVC